MVENDCMPKYEDDGKCLATDDQALQSITDIADVSGDWWVLKGQNCGQDDVWRGAYDWYPCQHGRFVKVGTTDQDWINNTTYCNGKDSTCTSEIIVTIPKLSLISPGVVRHDYPEGEAPIVPQVNGEGLDKVLVEYYLELQIEDWKFVAFPHPDWALVIWCGSNPVLKYNGAFVVSRYRSLEFLEQGTEDQLRKSASEFGIDFDAMCISDNTNCKE